MTTRFRITRLAATLPIAVCCALMGCETQITTVSDSPQAGDQVTPRVGLEAPTDLHDICGYLLRYRVEERTLPESLGELRERGIMPAEGYPGLDDYAYRAAGLGILTDGRTVLVVDTEVRVQGYFWCILSEPTRSARASVLEVSLVRIDDLRAAQRPRN